MSTTPVNVQNLSFKVFEMLDFKNDIANLLQMVESLNCKNECKLSSVAPALHYENFKKSILSKFKRGIKGDIYRLYKHIWYSLFDALFFSSFFFFLMHFFNFKKLYYQMIKERKKPQENI